MKLMFSYTQKNNFKVGEKTSAIPIAFMTREDGDHKIVAVDSTTEKRIKKWEDIPAAERDLFLRYFGYKSPIKTVKGAKEAIEYINSNRVNGNTKKPKIKSV